EIAWLARDGGQNLRDARHIISNNSSNVYLARDSGVFGVMAVARRPLQLWIEGVVHTDHAQVCVERELRETGKPNGIQAIPLRGVVPWRHHGPTLANGWRHAQVAWIAARCPCRT